jgi:arylsulfatase A-like enzyme
VGGPRGKGCDVKRILVVGTLLAAIGGHAAIATAQIPRRPRLVVVLVVDQMRADYIDRYGHQWSKGLKRLITEGAYYKQAYYPYLSTVTCVGHATISTGAFPATHGIVGNSWFDRESGRSIRCADDPTATTVSYAGPATAGNSPARLLVPTLSDEMRGQLPAARVVTLSLKERTAIMLAGRRADAAIWFSIPARGFVTSSVYTATPVPVISALIAKQPVEADFGKTWVRALPEAAYLFDDAGIGEKPPTYWTSTFPHELKGKGPTPDATFYGAWDESPFSDAYLGRLAAGAVDAMKLGNGPGTDFLGISFSALDLVGHDFGPASHEVQDVLARLDVTLGDLLANLDRAVGAGNYVVALSADHGVSPIPERMAGLGISAARVPTAAVVAAATQALKASPEGAKATARLQNAELYFDADSIARLRANPLLLDNTLRAIRAVPGVANVIFADALPALAAAGDHDARAALAGYYPGRSGQIVVVLRPYSFFVTDDGTAQPGDASSHGSLYDYDQHVPLVLFGSGIARGVQLRRVTPADVAPTLAYLCGITLARPDGEVLFEAVALARPPAATPAPAIAK